MTVTANLGRVQPIYRGAYNPATAYRPLDFVVQGGVTYYCIAPTTGNAPPNASFWQTLVEISLATLGVTATAAQINQGLVPAGTAIFHAASTAPTGYLKANGALVSRSTYAALFSAIGTTFGAGDGSTTFALPDLRGEFTRGWDDGRGIDSGRAFGSFQLGAVQNHVHNVSWTNGLYAAGGVTAVADIPGGSDLGETSTPTTGAAGETRPRNIALLACIKF